MNQLKFRAEVIEVKSKKTASLDVSYRVVIQTDDPQVLTLGYLDGDTILNLIIEEEE